MFLSPQNSHSLFYIVISLSYVSVKGLISNVRHVLVCNFCLLIGNIKYSNDTSFSCLLEIAENAQNVESWGGRASLG